MGRKVKFGVGIRCKAVLLGGAMAIGFGVSPTLSQTSQGGTEARPGAALPPVTIDAPARQATRRTAPRRAATRVRSAPRSVPAPAAPDVQQADRGTGAPERATGPVNGYVASQSATGTKTDTPILETPQAISVVTRDQMVAQQTQNIGEALYYTPGVSLDLYSATTFFDAIKVRGFDAPRYLDGLRLPLDPGTQFAYPRVEPYGLERLEVLRGPSSGLYGQTEPGGLINMVSKRPLWYPHYEVEGTFGSFERFQGAFDVGGPIDKNREFLYRVVGLGRLSDSQQDFVTDNKIFIAPSFTWAPTANTTFTLLSHYQKIDNDGMQQYVPGGVAGLTFNPFGRIPYSRYLGEPSVDGFKLEQGAVGYAFDHRFNNFLQFRQNFRYTDVTNDLTGVRSEGLTDFRNVQRSINYVSSSARNIALDNQLQADFATGPFVHKVLAGLDYINSDNRSDYRTSAIASIDAFAPVYGASLPPADTLVPFIKVHTKQEQLGIYLQDQIKFDRFTLSLTGRQDWADAETVSTGMFPQPGVFPQNDRATTGRVGINYLFDFGLAPYASYTTSFQPVANVDLAGNVFKPTTGEGKEIGVKFKPFGMNLLLTAAVFEIVQQNVLTPDPINPFFSVQTGEAKVRGFEFEVRGNVTRELEIVGGYSNLDPKVTSANDGTVGNYLPGVALQQASLWAKYTWYDGPLAGLGLGAGVRYVGENYGDTFNTIRIPSYTLFDASISYDFRYMRPDLKGWSVQVNATNLGDRYYVASCATGLAYCGLGASRRVLGTLRYAWN
ncbi:TonB-dependent siderophore receptor [Bradyrhizobium sp. LHD-71]|uniref:TonB-dependent siderophore receptor n=1 Tax=Bradyrhizobium sp. LHD-71 TaxID=3072141 RepID=UPI00280C6CC8|nr:TonB-dependent siderophore receptor [Bradyrhizobium sp. LHD-71]MDQ8728693.1 TonB-dependent siderophore receptor [Bradyrhizobium sp. LHD-71]